MSPRDVWDIIVDGDLRDLDRLPAESTHATDTANALDGLVGSRDARVAGLRRLAESLNGCDGLERSRVRFEAIDRLKAGGVAPDEARALVGAALAVEESNDPARRAQQGIGLQLTDSTPWAEPVDGVALSNEIADVIRRYVVLSESATTAAVLWVVMTHCLDHVAVAVRLILTSPTRECGKTRLLTLLSGLVRKPITGSSITPAVLFRVIEAHSPTVILDEADNARLNDNDELRALLNSGHTRATASVFRTVGEDHEPRIFSTWGAVGLAGIGSLPDTVTSRGVVLRLQRKPRDHSVARLRETRVHAELEPLRRKLVRWAADHGPSIADADPDLPKELDGRTADNWSVLIALAEALGGDWPKRARDAARAFAGGLGSEQSDVGELLLADIRVLFADRDVDGAVDRDRIASEDIVGALVGREDRPWPEWKSGRPLTTRGLASLLRRFGIEPRSVRFADGTTCKGYQRDSFEDAWSRYQAPVSGTAAQAASEAGETAVSDPAQDRAVPDGESASGPLQSRLVPYVPDRNQVIAEVAPSDVDAFVEGVLRGGS